MKPFGILKNSFSTLFCRKNLLLFSIVLNLLNAFLVFLVQVPCLGIIFSLAYIPIGVIFTTGFIISALNDEYKVEDPSFGDLFKATTKYFGNNIAITVVFHFLDMLGFVPSFFLLMAFGELMLRKYGELTLYPLLLILMVFGILFTIVNNFLNCIKESCLFSSVRYSENLMTSIKGGFSRIFKNLKALIFPFFVSLIISSPSFLWALIILLFIGLIFLIPFLSLEILFGAAGVFLIFAICLGFLGIVFSIFLTPLYHVYWVKVFSRLPENNEVSKY
jgi:hypothetical protein